MKIYLSGKISGDPKYKKRFSAASARLKKAGHIVLNPARLPPGLEYEDYMRIAFAMIDAADAVYLLGTWADSPGAKREYIYAEEKGRMILHGMKALKTPGGEL